MPKLKLNHLHYLWNQFKNRLTWACDNTNLHGFKYIANKDSSTITRLCFAFISCFSLGLCSYLIMLQLYEYNQQLIVTRIISTSYPVWQFRFPSVTICNFNVVYKRNINNLMKLATSNGIKQEIFMDFLSNLSALITYDDNLRSLDHYKDIYDVLEQNGYNADKMMQELAQPCDNMIKKCFWRAAEMPCNQIIQGTKTNNGHCCAFNYHGRRRISENLIRDPHNLNGTYMGLIGSNYGLRLLLNAEEDQYVSSIKPSYGFNILVQDGVDYPDMTLTTNTLLVAEEMKISVKPSIYVSSKDVKKTDVQQRQCLFEDEGHIEWSPIYSYRACFIQCRANAMYKLCGCVPFYHSVGTSRRICTLFDTSCLHLNIKKYTTLHVAENLATDKKEKEEEENDNDEEELENQTNDCQCYPQCNEKIFNIQANRYSVTSTFGYENINLSILNVYYNGANCIKTKRDVYYTWYRILSAVGGIFSLCLGGSIISVVECCYIIGKCVMYKQDNFQTNSEKVSKPVVTYIDINPSLGYRQNSKKKTVGNVKARMFVKAFGNR